MSNGEENRKDKEKSGRFSSAVVGFLISSFFTIIVAIIVGVIWRKKSGWYWFGAFFGIIMTIVFWFVIIVGIFSIR